ncbi:DEAD/DEAH box helicase [Aequorivita marina]|uniref:DEAD/DEAH box helicase n=1 Tax=Aequorivita marina TaxID=3073654 RepID=UPI002874EC83|nr:helicase-related protein [Aequorivita sp. S2608]MDS1299184.1 helicase-related protein [Aequorivita sp. S2608]
MLYKGKSCEIVGEKEVFGQRIAWIRLLEDNSFLEVPYEDLEKPESIYSIAYLRFISIAAKIKDEVAKKNILAPYESSLIPLPHQILVLEKVMQSQQNRFLLADEVGMGKTIETGLILKELKIRGDIKRTLVIVPKSSMMQWQSELKDHFNEVFHLYDSEMITSMARTFSIINADEEFNFWTQHNQIIVSTDALKPLEKRQGWSQERVDEYNKYRMAAVLEADFDMVIIDEAHKMGGANATVSRYILAQELCNSVPNVLLLTATPHRGKEDHFRRILQLLDPDAFTGVGLPDIEELEPYVIRTEKRFAVDYDGKKLFTERQTHRFDVFLDINKHQKQMALYDAVTNYVQKGFNTAKRTKNNATGLIMILFQRLVSSSTASILSAMKGRLERLRLGEENQMEDYAAEVDNLTDDNGEDIDFDEIYQYDPRGFEDEEALLSSLIVQAEDCIDTETDAKAEALYNKIIELQRENNNPDIKILVFTEFRTTQRMLCDFLRKKGSKVAFIHGGQDLDERKRALLQFKNESQIMVATDAAGESLNMQFCHIVVNYDLPWNPMMIEQRIGRVDRIGQKKKVQAYNMLTNNSVDLRVYEVIEEKLNNIIEQLGIDKTTDVLDSAIDMKKVNKLYLQSLLNPERFDFASDQWLHEIKGKLKDYKSTERILPQVDESEIDFKKAAEIKHSPLPYWLEALIEQYTITQNGSVIKSQAGYSEVHIKNTSKKITFDSEVSLNQPGIEHLSLQHDWVKKLLNGLGEFDHKNGVPVITSELGQETPGYWSLWQITAKNGFENKTQYQAFFLSDTGKQYSAYANDIWNRLIGGTTNFRIEEVQSDMDISEIEKTLNDSLYVVFQNLQAEVFSKISAKKENRINSFNFQKSRIDKIGIENIRLSKLSKLEKQQEDWMRDFKMDNRVIPGIKQLLSIRVDG